MKFYFMKRALLPCTFWHGMPRIAPKSTAAADRQKTLAVPRREYSMLPHTELAHAR